MRRTALLAAIAVTVTLSDLHAEGPNPLAEFLPGSRQFYFVPQLIPSGADWKLELDEKLDGKLTAQNARLIELEAANNRLVGHWKDADQPHHPGNSIFSGQLIPGTFIVVNLREDAQPGYTAVYIGRLVSAEKIVGSYTDTLGRAGDWALTRVKKTSKVEPAPEKKVAAGPLKIDPLAQSLTDDLYFESVLGAYGRAIRGDRSRFINLRPPNRNLWTDEIENALDGTLSYAEVDYIGTAKLLIPEQGTYTLEMPGANVEFRINDQRVKAGELKLKKGLYDIEIYTNHWGQPYLKFAQVFIHKKGSSENIPFINAASDVEKFRKQKIGGKPVVEVCDYELKPVKLDENQALPENRNP